MNALFQFGKVWSVFNNLTRFLSHTNVNKYNVYKDFDDVIHVTN